MKNLIPVTGVLRNYRAMRGQCDLFHRQQKERILENGMKRVTEQRDEIYFHGFKKLGHWEEVKTLTAKKEEGREVRKNK